MYSVELTQVLVLISILSIFVVLTVLINKGLKEHIAELSKKVEIVERVRLLEFSRDLLEFFSQSNASTAVQEMVEKIVSDVSDESFTAISLTAGKDIEKLYTSMKSALNPVIEFSRVRSVSQFLFRLIVLDGAILSFITAVVIFFIAISDLFSLYKFLESITIAWGITFSISLTLLGTHVMRFDKKLMNMEDVKSKLATSD